MIDKTKSLFSVLLVLLVFGCALHPKHEFDRDAHKNINKIVLIEPNEPETYDAFIDFHPIGGLISLADAETKSERFTQALKKRDLRLAEKLSSSIEQ